MNASSTRITASTRPRVLCCWDRDLGDAILGDLPASTDVVWQAPDAAFLREHLGEFDAYLASLHVVLDGEMIRRAAPRLRFVATPSTGLDHLDLKAMAQVNVRLICLKDEQAFLDRLTATAELAWGLMLAVARRLPAAHAAACRGQWARDRFRGHQLSGKTLGILGVGRLGRMMAAYGQAFRMNVLGCDLRSINPASVPGLRFVDLETLLRESDVLSIHIHLTDANRGLLSAQRIAQMKRGAILINTSRGAIIEEVALLKALQSGHLGGAGLDVIEGEWRGDLSEHPLVRYAREHENLVISPHIGGVTWESQLMAFQFIANRLKESLSAERQSL